MSAATAPPPDSLAARFARLEEAVEIGLHRLETLIRAKLAPPVRQLRLAEAAKLGFARRTLQRMVARRVFTDDRAGKRKGSPVKLYEDELKVFRTDGEKGVLRLREELGRD